MKDVFHYSIQKLISITTKEKLNYETFQVDLTSMCQDLEIVGMDTMPNRKWFHLHSFEMLESVRFLKVIACLYYKFKSSIKILHQLNVALLFV